MAKVFLLTAGMILAFTGGAKVFSAAVGKAQALDLPDPILGIPFWLLLLLAGIVEFIIAIVCLATKKEQFGLMLVAWIATTFLVYRVGLGVLGRKQPCPCLGNITETLRISPQTADGIMKMLLSYLLVGSFIILLNYGRRRKRDSA